MSFLKGVEGVEAEGEVGLFLLLFLFTYPGYLLLIFFFFRSKTVFFLNKVY